jgi:DNA-binding transcriptional regulator YbjK
MNRSKVHRASAQRRRASLLEAAAELSAEVGAGSVTHRAIAARAGVPLSTTSYFFESIGEILTEALRDAAAGRVDEFDAAERTALLCEGASTAEVLGRVAESEVASSRTVQAAQAELYLAAGRQPELRGEVQATAGRFAERIATHLERREAPQAQEAAVALVSLADGELLHRLSSIDVDHTANLAAGLRLIVAAAQLTDSEITDLLGRYDAG